MQSFLEDSLLSIKQKYDSLDDLIFILPSQRAGSKLKQLFATNSKKPAFLPEILSIENFVQNISKLEALDSTQCSFKLYEVYLQITPENEQEDFQTFNSWAQTIIQDFNEIDRYLIPAQDIFNYLALIKDKDHWYLSEPKTEIIESYLRFWNQLPKLYDAFKNSLLTEAKAYQGLQYRVAANLATEYANSTDRPHIFLGFNALNKAEQVIIETLRDKSLVDMYWDIDNHFMQDNIHDASYFIRRYTFENSFIKSDKSQLSNTYLNPKEINIIGTPKKIGQSKTIGSILSKLSHDELKSTAVILGDESLLLPTLNAIPEAIKDINITMGLPLKEIPLASLFELLFQIQSQREDRIYYKLILDTISHPSLQVVLNEIKELIANEIRKQNLVTIHVDDLKFMLSDKNGVEILELLFAKVKSPISLIRQCQNLILKIKSKLSKEDAILREYLFSFDSLFNELEVLIQENPFLNTIQVLYQVYKDALLTKTLDFIGKKHDGLQIMGVLESRVLDFETVIIASVNEGVFPSGKSNNSYIPYDVKKDYDLPTYKEKDAIYTYHFYHMLQRAENIHIIYNTEPGDLNSGEKSRFITQLEVDSKQLPQHNFQHKVYVPKVPSTFSTLRQITKTPQVIEQIKARALKGFSPSALTTYIRNPIDFYNRYVLGVGEADDVEETIAYNTLGTVVHDTLEKLYEPYKDEILNKDSIKKMKALSVARITKEFTHTYSKTSLDTGKNLLIFEVAKRYVDNFLNLELDRIQSGEDIQIVDLEADLHVELNIPNIPFTVNLRGQVDRVDITNGVKRIIDYKTGKVEHKHVIVKDWEDITTDYDKYSKAFQILQYAYMMHLEKPFTESIEAGIISFKNLRNGFLPFKFNKEASITPETFNEFEKQLKHLISEICNPEIPFVEKELPEPFTA